MLLNWVHQSWLRPRISRDVAYDQKENAAFTLYYVLLQKKIVNKQVTKRTEQ